MRNTSSYHGFSLANGNIFAYIGAESAFRHGGPWLALLQKYLQENIDHAIEYLHRELPAVNVMRPEASFLLWMDFSALGLPHAELRRRFIHNAQVALNDGTDFGGTAYEGCFRMNVGCPRSLLDEGLQRIIRCLL